MPFYHKPHSPAWFQALEQFDPILAAHARNVVKAVGKNDICSVCGDEAAMVYKRIKPNLPDDAVATILLCDFCRDLRASAYGEIFAVFVN
jgi:hypothetical protein